MPRDYRTLFRALGFIAVVLRDTPTEQHSLHAESLARLVESFCDNALADSFLDESPEVMDLRTLSLALAFTAVVMRDDLPPQGRATRAHELAKLIEAFCQQPTKPQTSHEVDMLAVDITGRELRFGLHLEMADAIVIVMQKGLVCEPCDMLIAGFSHDEINRLFPTALALAKIHLGWGDAA